MSGSTTIVGLVSAAGHGDARLDLDDHRAVQLDASPLSAASAATQAPSRREAYGMGGRSDDLPADIERIAPLLAGTGIVEAPRLTPYLSSLWLNLVTPVSASVARPLVEGLRNPTIAREERIRNCCRSSSRRSTRRRGARSRELRGHLAAPCADAPGYLAASPGPPDFSTAKEVCARVLRVSWTAGRHTCILFRQQSMEPLWSPVVATGRRLERMVRRGRRFESVRGL